MFIGDLIVALIIGLILALILSAFATSRGAAAGVGAVFLFFFLFFFFAVWAGGVWLTPIGPPIWGIPWLSFLWIGLLFALLVAALIPPSERERRAPGGPPEAERAEETRITEEEPTGAEIAFGIFFWLLLLFLIISIIWHYAWIV